MTAFPAPQPAIPQWLVDAVLGLVASAYQAGLAQAAAEVPRPEPDVLNRVEAAALLRCSRTKLDGLVREGLVPSFMLGSTRLFRRAELLAHLSGERAA